MGSSDDEPPYRRRAPAAPAALRELAEGADEKRLVLPKQARDLDRTERLDLSLGARSELGCLTMLIGIGAAVFVVGGATAPWALIPGLGLAVGAYILYLAGERTSRTRRKAALGEHDARGYPLRDYELWLAADRPLLDVVLRGPAEQALVVDAVHAVDPEIDVAWLTDSRVRLAIPPVRLRAVSKSASELWGGDRTRLAEILDKIVDPLHLEVGVDHVDLGGTMTRLPAPAD